MYLSKEYSICKLVYRVIRTALSKQVSSNKNKLRRFYLIMVFAGPQFLSILKEGSEEPNQTARMRMLKWAIVIHMSRRCILA